MSERIEGFHSYWSRPGRVKHYGEVRFPDYELATAALSALEWRAHNGPIRMICDSPGADFFRSVGLDGLWDTVDVGLDGIPEKVDPYLFWAAGKLYALRSMPCPCAMLDTDLVVWRRLELPPEADIVAAHSEGLSDDVYPDPRGFSYKVGYSLPAEWDPGLDAANTAFLYIKDPGFRDRYVDSALAFMAGVDISGLDPVTAMCCAEQRVLPMCAAAEGRRLDYLMDLAAADLQDTVTHIWGYKYHLEQSERERTAFCVRCVRRAVRDFPEAADLIGRSTALGKYLRAAYESI